MWALPRMWRRKRFIVQCPLVGDPVRIWIANSQIAVGCFNSATSTLGGGAQTPETWNRGRMRTGVGPQHPVHWQASRQPSRGAGSEHKIGQERDKCSDGGVVRNAWIRMLGGQVDPQILMSAGVKVKAKGREMCTVRRQVWEEQFVMLMKGSGMMLDYWTSRMHALQRHPLSFHRAGRAQHAAAVAAAAAAFCED